MTHSNITSGFKATGLYPFNPQAIPETAFAPSILTEAPACLALYTVNKENMQPPNSSALLALDIVDKENSQLPDSHRSTTLELCNKSPADVSSASTSTGRLGQTLNRLTDSFYRAVHGTSSSDDGEDNAPLAEPKKIGFQQLMLTPVKSTQKTPIIRKKALNYRGTPVTKDLFEKHSEGKKKMKKISTPKKKKTTSIKKSTAQKEKRWYCHGCEENEIADMRQCSKCGKWYHEECVGLSVDDTDDFKCC